MGDYKEIIDNLVYFLIFVVVILIIASFVMNIIFKKFSFSTKKGRLYGILYNLNNREIAAISLTTINYLFLVWSAMMIVKMNPLYISLILFMTILSSILSKDYLKIPINIVVGAINSFALYILNFVHVYLVGEVNDIFMRISIFLILSFIYIYFTYNYINDINDIAEKSRRKVGGDNEN